MRISGAERDALFEQIHARLSGIDEVWAAAAAEEWEQADRAAREFSDYLRVIVEDLGWGETGEELELTTPPEILRRVLARIQGRGEEWREIEEEERAELRSQEERTAALLEVCRRVLGELADAA